MKRIVVHFFLFLFLFCHDMHTFIMHQSGKFLKTYRMKHVKTPAVMGHSFLKRFVWKKFSPRHFLRFFSTSLFRFRQRFPITFKRQTALFSAKVDLKNVLMGYVDKEKQKISIAIYLLTDKDIAQAIVQAYQRGVKVEIVTDKNVAKGVYSQIPFLERSGIPVFFYECPGCPSGIMHQKFAVFKGQKLVWNGSFNFTKTASEKNRENVVLMRDKEIFKQFQKNFDEMKQEVIEKAQKIEHSSIFNCTFSLYTNNKIYQILRISMKTEIHPKTNPITAKCACGATYDVDSTASELKVTICANCHPFFTGQQKFVDTAGRIEKFNKKYEKVSKK